MTEKVTKEDIREVLTAVVNSQASGWNKALSYTADVKKKLVDKIYETIQATAKYDTIDIGIDSSCLCSPTVSLNIDGKITLINWKEL